MKKILMVAIIAVVASNSFAFDGVTYTQWNGWTILQKAAWLDSFRGGFCSGALWAAEFEDRPDALKNLVVEIDGELNVKYGEAVALIDFQWLQQGYENKSLQIVASSVFFKLYDRAFRNVSEKYRGGRAK